MGESEPVELEGGLRVRGRIDRVDECDGMALVIDYKSGKRVDRYKVARWEPENRLQAALYMLAVERAARAARRPAASTWRSAADDPRPRGIVASDVDELGRALVRHATACDAEEFEAKLDWARERDPRDRRRDARRRAARLPGPLRLERRLRVPVDLPERASERS